MKLSDIGINTKQVFTFGEADVKKIFTKLLEDEGYTVHKVTISATSEDRGDQRDSYTVTVFQNIQVEVSRK